MIINLGNFGDFSQRFDSEKRLWEDFWLNQNSDICYEYQMDSNDNASIASRKKFIRECILLELCWDIEASVEYCELVYIHTLKKFFTNAPDDIDMMLVIPCIYKFHQFLIPLGEYIEALKNGAVNYFNAIGQPFLIDGRRLVVDDDLQEILVSTYKYRTPIEY